uniref:Uncharacterized protein n=1 Tax=Arundo donax TaxID=35708 RepID=A0A0A9AMF1_ARUDO
MDVLHAALHTHAKFQAPCQPCKEPKMDKQCILQYLSFFFWYPNVLINFTMTFAMCSYYCITISMSLGSFVEERYLYLFWQITQSTLKLGNLPYVIPNFGMLTFTV